MSVNVNGRMAAVAVGIAVALGGGYQGKSMYDQHNEQHIVATQTAKDFQVLKEQHDKNMKAIQQWSITVTKRLGELEKDVKWLKERDGQKASK